MKARLRRSPRVILLSRAGISIFAVISALLIGFFSGTTVMGGADIMREKRMLHRCEESVRDKEISRLAGHIRSVNPALGDSMSMIIAGEFYRAADSASEGSDFALLLAAVAETESEYRLDVVSSKGAVGMCQIIPVTARNIARSNGLEYSREMLYDPAYCIKIQAIILKELREKHGIAGACAGYNGGPKSAKKLARGQPIPNETRKYIADVKISLKIIKKSVK